MWTYATCCMSFAGDDLPLELHMHSPRPSIDIVELLYATTHFHRTKAQLGFSHTVFFGRPWLGLSACEHGYVSTPYLDGPDFEKLQIGNKTVEFGWLLPVTKSEVEFAIRYGAEALEREFERAELNYLDPSRASVV